MLERYEPWSKESIHSIRPSKLCSTRRRVVQGGNSSFSYRHERQEDEGQDLTGVPLLRRRELLKKVLAENEVIRF